MSKLLFSIVFLMSLNAFATGSNFVVDKSNLKSFFVEDVLDDSGDKTHNIKIDFETDAGQFTAIQRGYNGWGQRTQSMATFLHAVAQSPIQQTCTVSKSCRGEDCQFVFGYKDVNWGITFTAEEGKVTNYQWFQRSTKCQ